MPRLRPTLLVLAALIAPFLACTGTAELVPGSSTSSIVPSGAGGGGGTGSGSGGEVTGDGGTSQPVDAGGASSDGGGVVVVPDGGGPVGVPDAGPAPFDAGTPPHCGALAARVTSVQVSVAPAQVDVGNDWGWSANRPVMIAPMPNGRLKIAWTTSDAHVHVTPLDASLSREGPDVVLDGNEVRGFVAHADGSVAVMVVRGTTMNLIKLKADGTQDWLEVLVGDPPSDTVAGSRWVDNWGHEGRMVWTGQVYASYFGHTKYWGAQGKHQGDRLVSTDADGGATWGPSGWDWGCSHSLDVRLAWDGSSLAPVCVSDCYSAKAILRSDATMLSNEPSGNCAGSSDAQLGGLAALPGGGFGFTFSSKEGRADYDVGFVKLSSSGTPAATVWLTTGGGDDQHPATARMGTDRLLVAWRTQSGAQMETVSFDGAVQEGPVALPATWASRDDFVTLDTGDVVVAGGNGQNLAVTRVQHCVP
jgi:hypothetical protein